MRSNKSGILPFVIAVGVFILCSIVFAVVFLVLVPKTPNKVGIKENGYYMVQYKDNGDYASAFIAFPDETMPDQDLATIKVIAKRAGKPVLFTRCIINSQTLSIFGANVNDDVFECLVDIPFLVLP